MALQPLLHKHEGHRWALHHVAGFLGFTDAARLALMALESGRADLRPLLHWLLHGDAPFPPLTKSDLLFEAVRLAAWPTAIQLLQQIKCDAPPQGAARASLVQKTTAPLLLQDPWPLLTAAHDGSGVLFPVDVLEAAALRGDLACVQWLLLRVKRGVNTVTMEQGRQVEIPEDELDIINTALHTAADAHHLHVVDWLVTASPRIHCVLRLDDELRAVCWYTCDYGVYFFSSATAQYGQQLASMSSDVAGDGTGVQPSHMPLANHFARDGDLTTLAKIYDRANRRALISPQALESAAASGHLTILQWLHKRFPMFLTSSCLAAAAKGGHMDVLQWLAPFRLPVQAPCVVDAAAAGHVEVLRWLRVQDPSVWATVRQGAMIEAARQGRLNVVRFYHEECGVELISTLLQPITACKNVETVEYILDRVHGTPFEFEQFLHFAASDSTLAVVEYLVTQRRLWSREAFEDAVYRETSRRADEAQRKSDTLTALAISQFLITQARVRAETMGTPLDAHVVLDDVCIFHIADLQNYEIAEWIARALPEADCDPEKFLDGNEYRPRDDRAAKMTPIVLACLQYRRRQCRSVAWMPRWAVIANCAEAFAQLVEIEHPSLGSIEVQRAIVETTRDGRFMTKLMSRMDRGTLSTDIVTWASSYGIVPVLKQLYFQEAHAKRQRLLQLVATRGAEHGHVDVLEWVLSTCNAHRLPKVIVFNAAASGAARCGHVDVLQWLESHEGMLPLADADTMASIVREAARHQRLDCLRWLLRNKTVPPRVVAQILLDAVKRKQDAVVALLTSTHAPSDLSLSKADAARVRAFVRAR